jgi:hypothetical protein
MAERLYISERACRACWSPNRTTSAGGFVMPASGELRELMDRLVYYYGKHLVVISNLIHSKPRTRLHEFSEAFSLKKKDS